MAFGKGDWNIVLMGDNLDADDSPGTALSVWSSPMQTMLHNVFIVPQADIACDLADAVICVYVGAVHVGDVTIPDGTLQGEFCEIVWDPITATSGEPDYIFDANVAITLQIFTQPVDSTSTACVFNAFATISGQ